MPAPDYRLQDGTKTTDSDPERLLWYGPCGFYTDNWCFYADAHGAPLPGVPCCPDCKAPGFQIVARSWWLGAANFESQGHPGYVEFLELHKEHCYKKHGDSTRSAYAKWVAQKGKAPS